MKLYKSKVVIIRDGKGRSHFVMGYSEGGVKAAAFRVAKQARTDGAEVRFGSFSKNLGKFGR